MSKKNLHNEEKELDEDQEEKIDVNDEEENKQEEEEEEEELDNENTMTDEDLKLAENERKKLMKKNNFNSKSSKEKQNTLISAYNSQKNSFKKMKIENPILYRDRLDRQKIISAKTNARNRVQREQDRIELNAFRNQIELNPYSNFLPVVIERSDSEEVNTEKNIDNIESLDKGNQNDQTTIEFANLQELANHNQRDLNPYNHPQSFIERDYSSENTVKTSNVSNIFDSSNNCSSHSECSETPMLTIYQICNLTNKERSIYFKNLGYSQYEKMALFYSFNCPKCLSNLSGNRSNQELHNSSCSSLNNNHSIHTPKIFLNEIDITNSEEVVVINCFTFNRKSGYPIYPQCLLPEYAQNILDLHINQLYDGIDEFEEYIRTHPNHCLFGKNLHFEIISLCFNVNAAHDFPWYHQHETWNPVNLVRPLYECGYDVSIKMKELLAHDQFCLLISNTAQDKDTQILSSFNFLMGLDNELELNYSRSELFTEIILHPIMFTSQQMLTLKEICNLPRRLFPYYVEGPGHFSCLVITGNETMTGIYNDIGNHDDFDSNWHLDTNRQYTPVEKLNKIKLFKHMRSDRAGRNISNTFINMTQITEVVIAGLLQALLLLRGEDFINEDVYVSDNDD